MKAGTITGVLAASLAIVWMTGCESGDEGDDELGSSSVQGYVQEFNAAGVSVLFGPDRDSKPARLVRLAGELIIPSAHAALGGVQVSVEGTDLVTSSGANGFFLISGVPSGRQRLVFTYAQQTAVYGLDVPDRTRIEMAKVRVLSGGNVRVEGLRHIQLASPKPTKTPGTTAAKEPAPQTSQQTTPTAENQTDQSSTPTKTPVVSSPTVRPTPIPTLIPISSPYP